MRNLNEKLPKQELFLDKDYDSTVTGITTEFTHDNITIPPYKFPVSGFVEINAIFRASSNSNTKNYRIYYGGSVIKNFAINGNNQSVNLQARIYFRNSRESQITPNLTSGHAFENNTFFPTETTIDTKINKDLSIRSKLSNASNSVTLKKVIIKITRK